MSASRPCRGRDIEGRRPKKPDGYVTSKTQSYFICSCIFILFYRLVSPKEANYQVKYSTGFRQRYDYDFFFNTCKNRYNFL